jgi:hypothetical protein
MLQACYRYRYGRSCRDTGLAIRVWQIAAGQCGRRSCQCLLSCVFSVLHVADHTDIAHCAYGCRLMCGCAGMWVIGKRTNFMDAASLAPVKQAGRTLATLSMIGRRRASSSRPMGAASRSHTTKPAPSFSTIQSQRPRSLCQSRVCACKRVSSPGIEIIGIPADVSCRLPASAYVSMRETQVSCKVAVSRRQQTSADVSIGFPARLRSILST